MANESKIFDQAEQLKAMVRDWIPKRKKTVVTLKVLADKLMEHHNNVCIAKVAGSSAAVAGFVLTAVGFGLSFVTFGTSLILAGVGVGVGGAGGLTSLGSGIAEVSIERNTFKDAQKIVADDREATEAIEKLLVKLEKAVVVSTIKNSVKAGATSTFTVTNFVATGFKMGVGVAGRAVGEGGEALFRGLSGIGKVAHIGGFVIGAALLPLDIYDLVTNSMKIDASRKGKKDEEPEAVKKLRGLADELEKDMPDENEFARKLDDFISTAGMV